MIRCRKSVPRGTEGPPVHVTGGPFSLRGAGRGHGPQECFEARSPLPILPEDPVRIRPLFAGDTLAIRQAVADGAVVDSLDTRTTRNGRRALNWAARYGRVDAIGRP